MYLIWLSIFGNGGWGNFGNANGAGVGRAELADGLNNQTVLNDLRNIETGIAGVSEKVQSTGNNMTQALNAGVSGINHSLCSGFAGVNSNINQSTNSINSNVMNGFNNVGMSILSNTNGITNAINQASANQQIANCNLSHAIQDNKYEMAQNTTMITNAIREEGETTRKALIDQQIQDLRDSREAVQRDLQSAQLTLANVSQTQNILGSLGRYVAYTGCGSNCNCSF